MTLKRLFLVAPAALAVIVAGSASSPGEPSPLTVRLADMVVPSALPSAAAGATSTLTPILTITPTSSLTPTPTQTPARNAIPVPARDSILRIDHVPILMYHYVSVPVLAGILVLTEP